MNTLSLETVLQIHNHLVKTFANSKDPISPPGVRDMGLLESAVSRQHVGSGRYHKYPGPFANAATLMFGICNNHAFYNGNKRTALVAGLVHLDSNGLVLYLAKEDSLYDLILAIASHMIAPIRKTAVKKGIRPTPDDEVKAIAGWLKYHARKIVKGERTITFRQLFKILKGFECVIGGRRNNKVEIFRRKTTRSRSTELVCVYKVPCRSDSGVVPLNEIKKIRKILSLREEDGVDSRSFYDTRRVIDGFIRSHRSVLRRLARV